MTAPTQRIEVITRGERRRRWSIEEKREIVAESLGTGVRPSEGSCPIAWCRSVELLDGSDRHVRLR